MALRTPVPPNYCGYRSPAVCKTKKCVAHSFYFIIHFILSFIVHTLSPGVHEGFGPVFLWQP